MENRRQFKITAEVYAGQRAKMATESFYETMVIDTPEAGANLAKAIEHYEKYGPTSLRRFKVSLEIPRSWTRSWACLLEF